MDNFLCQKTFGHPLSFPFDYAAFTSDGDILFNASVGSNRNGIYRYSTSGALSKVIATGDSLPGSGTIDYPVLMGANAVSGRSVTFSAYVSNGSTADIVAFKSDVTQAGTGDVKVVAYQSESTGTAAGGTFCQSGPGGVRPFDRPPSTRWDGAVLFFSYLCNAVANNGSAATQGLFLWDGKQIQQLVLDGETNASGKTDTGIYYNIMNDLGTVYYFANQH
jgi:hypothetical protein